MQNSNGFGRPVIINMLGGPGAGKGTLSTHLAERYSLAHYSVGDGLRDWMRENSDQPLAAAIQDKLDNQGFLDSKELNPFIRQAIAAAITHPKQEFQGVLIDGYPRCLEQLNSFDMWPFEDVLPRHGSGDTEHDRAPDIVIAVHVSKANARTRYVERMRDARDSAEKFERRFAEYENETRPVEDIYRSRGTLIEVDANGTREESIEQLEQQLGKSWLWNRLNLEATTKRGFRHVEKVGLQ